MIRIISICSIFLSASICFATSQESLSWKFSSQHIPYEPGGEVVESIYPFTNKSDKSITIQSIQTGCDCTEALVEKKTYKPGEDGLLVVIFSVETREGPQKKKVTVLTNDSEKPVHELTFSTTIPYWCQVEPSVLQWSADGNEIAEPKVLQATIIPSAGRTIESVRLVEPAKDFLITMRESDINWQVQAQSASVGSKVETLEFVVTFSEGIQKTRKLVLQQR